MNIRIPVLCVMALVSHVAGEIVDRIAVIAGKQVIKRSDIDRDIKLTAFLNGEKPELGSASRRKAAERLIDQTSIRDSIVGGGYSRPTEAEVQALLEQIRRDRFGGSDARLATALRDLGLTEQDLRKHLNWQLTVLKFINERFRPGVQISEEALRSYYNQHMAALKKEHPDAQTYEALEPRVREILEGEGINKNFEQWLTEARTRNRVEFKEEAFR